MGIGLRGSAIEHAPRTSTREDPRHLAVVGAVDRCVPELVSTPSGFLLFRDRRIWPSPSHPGTQIVAAEYRLFYWENGWRLKDTKTRCAVLTPGSSEVVRGWGAKPYFGRAAKGDMRITWRTESAEELESLSVDFDQVRDYGCGTTDSYVDRDAIAGAYIVL
jgi:hypothetical protein